jgi:hypothetical protein
MNDCHIKKIIEKERRRSLAMAFILFLQIVFLAFVIFLTSCTSQARTQTQTRTVGVQAGQETNLTETTITASTETSGVDVAAVVSAAVQASQGKILGALGSLKPAQISEEASPDWTTLGGAGAGIGLSLLLAWMKSREAAAIRKDKETIASDRDDAYERLIEANRQLPPKTSKG